MPAHAGPGAECVSDLRFSPQRAQGENECSRQVERPARIGESRPPIIGLVEPEWELCRLAAELAELDQCTEVS
jgi:hypothetical protein